MKASKVLGFSAAILAAAILVSVGCVQRHVRLGCWVPDACDFKMRYAEILCAHQGVNSFHIWNRDVSLPGFDPLFRPDMPTVDYQDGALCVHAYPPWEVCFFYFLGWLPFKACLALMICLSVWCVFYMVQNSFSLANLRGICPWLVATLSLLMVTKEAGRCFITLNYSVMLLALVVLMFRSLDKRHPIVAGICWAIVMIKPQFGVLFFWPLLFSRCYKTILTAVALCLGATMIMSFVYGESVLALILQVPQIGAPYCSLGFVDAVFAPLFGRAAVSLWMGICFFACGIWCFQLRKSDDFLVRCFPVAAIVPIWTYSQECDHVILWIFYMVVLRFVLSPNRIAWKACFVAVLLGNLLCVVWEFNLVIEKLHFFNPQGLGWMYYIVKYGKGVLIAALAVKCVARENARTCQPLAVDQKDV